MTAVWRDVPGDDDRDEEGRRWGYPDPRPLRLEDYLLAGLVVLMALVCLALAGGYWA